MRMGLTARFVKPESVPQDQHWKGDFTIPEEFIYDGDINIVAKVQAAKLARENAVENDIGGDGEEV